MNSSFSQRATAITAQEMASLLLNECVCVYDMMYREEKKRRENRQPTDRKDKTQTHRDNVTIVVMKLQWIVVSGDGDAYPDDGYVLKYEC
jgi:hypothetical protein